MKPNIELIVHFLRFFLISDSIFWGKTLVFSKKFYTFAFVFRDGIH